MRVVIARRSFRPSHDHRIVGKCNCWTQLVRPAGLVHARVERSEARGELETAGSETLRGTWRVVRPAGLVHARVERSEARGELETAGSETLRGTWRVVRPAGLEPATSWFVATSCFARCKSKIY